MRRHFCRTIWGALALSLGAVAFSMAQDSCPPMPDKITQDNHDVLVDVNANVGSLGKVKAGQIGIKTEVVARNLFDKYPNVDRLVIAQMMAATYCPMIRDDKALKDADKRHLWNEFQDRVFRFVNPSYNPSPSSPSRSKSKVSSEKAKETSSLSQAGSSSLKQRTLLWTQGVSRLYAERGAKWENDSKLIYQSEEYLKAAAQPISKARERDMFYVFQGKQNAFDQETERLFWQQFEEDAQKLANEFRAMGIDTTFTDKALNGKHSHDVINGLRALAAEIDDNGRLL